MNILITLTYYRPHTSGLTIYTERLARALASRGHQVTVLTSRFDRALPAEEEMDGVNVVRLPVAFRVSKGVIMPSMPLAVLKYGRDADVVNLHMPQFDAAYIALISKLLGKPVILTYQCDLKLPKGLNHQVANVVSNVMNNIAALTSDAIISITKDYADHSRYLQRYLRKVRAIKGPIELVPISDEDLQAFKKKHAVSNDQKTIGILARLATEKGVEYLVWAMPKILERFPQAKVLYVGPYQNLLGEEKYAERLMPLIEKLGDRWEFLGRVPDKDLTAFLKASDVLVLPSINSTEGYGLVQIEAMQCGTPVAASNLPGVRIPVQESGMGLVFHKEDSDSLAQAVINILSEPHKFQTHPTAFLQEHEPDKVAEEYEKLFKELLHAR